MNLREIARPALAYIRGTKPGDVLALSNRPNIIVVVAVVLVILVILLLLLLVVVVVA